jgi:hypothetical protein
VMRGRGPLPPNGYPAGPHLPGGPGFRGRGYIDFRGQALPGRGFVPRGRGRDFPARGRGPRPDDRYQPQPEPVLYETADGLVVADDEFEVEEEEEGVRAQLDPQEDLRGEQEGGGLPPVTRQEELRDSHAAHASLPSALAGDISVSVTQIMGDTPGDAKTERFSLGSESETPRTVASNALPECEQGSPIAAHVHVDVSAAAAAGPPSAEGGAPGGAKGLQAPGHQQPADPAPPSWNEPSSAMGVPLLEVRVREPSSSVDIGGNSLLIEPGSPLNPGGAVLGGYNNDGGGEVESPNKGPDTPAPTKSSPRPTLHMSGTPKGVLTPAPDVSHEAPAMPEPMPQVPVQEIGRSAQAHAHSHGPVEGLDRVSELHPRHHSRRDKNGRDSGRHRDAQRIPHRHRSPHVSSPQRIAPSRAAPQPAPREESRYRGSPLLSEEPSAKVLKERRQQDLPVASGGAEGLWPQAEPVGKRRRVERVPPPEDPVSSDSELPEALARIAARRDAKATDPAPPALLARSGRGIRPRLPSSSTPDSEDGVELPNLPARRPGVAARTVVPATGGADRRRSLLPKNSDSDDSSASSQRSAPQGLVPLPPAASKYPATRSIVDTVPPPLDERGPPQARASKGHSTDVVAAPIPQPQNQLSDALAEDYSAGIVEEAAPRERMKSTGNAVQRGREEGHERPRFAGNAGRSGRDAPRQQEPPRAHWDERGNHGADRRMRDQPRPGYDHRRHRQERQHQPDAAGRRYEGRGYDGPRPGADSHRKWDSGGPPRLRQNGGDARSHHDRRGTDGCAFAALCGLFTQPACDAHIKSWKHLAYACCTHCVTIFPEQLSRIVDSTACMLLDLHHPAKIRDVCPWACGSARAQQDLYMAAVHLLCCINCNMMRVCIRGAHRQQASRDRGGPRKEDGSRGRHRSRSPR